jgi:hypothetical protein
MFALAVIIGIYSYIIFILGLAGLLRPFFIVTATVLFLAGSIFYFKKNPQDIPSVSIKNKNKPLLMMILILSLINLLGALAPELSFDALWYHLTIPKIFLEAHRIFYIEGGLFYYSLMPKLGEMLFVPGIMFGSEIPAKLVQWMMGLLSALVVYKISRKYFDEKVSLIASVIFYSSLVVAWESTVAYVDLIRAFFESMALWGFLNFLETKSKKWLVESAVMLGLAISTKIIAFASLPIFLILMLLYLKDKAYALKSSLIFVLVSVGTVSPWLFFAFFYSGNPFFPFFSKHFESLESGLIGLHLLNPIHLIRSFINLFLLSPDPISPVYLAFLPVLILFKKNFDRRIMPVLIYSILAIIAFYPLAGVGGTRFILAYLPAFSVIAVSLLLIVPKNIKTYMTFFILLAFLITCIYRGASNVRYLPVILGMQTKDEFLNEKLNFKFGDFYVSESFTNGLTDNDMVLIYGSHNLYHADFPFVHESYIKEGDRFNFVATHDSKIPDRFSRWPLVYANEKSKIYIYSGGMHWSY